MIKLAKWKPQHVMEVAAVFNKDTDNIDWNELNHKTLVELFKENP